MPSAKLIKNFCNCIKSVRRSIKAKSGTKEQAAIAVCVKSVLGSRRMTLRKFSCKKHKLSTRRLRKRRAN